MFIETVVVIGLLGFFIGVPMACKTYHTPVNREVIIDPFHSRNNIQ